MKKIFDQIVPRTMRRDNKTSNRSNDAQWRQSGHVYYLLNTLKLSYESQSGRVTYEKINLDSLHALCSELQQGRCTAPKETACLPELFSLSVCGVCWDEMGTQVRTKAIPEAACIRFENIEYSASEAKFQMSYRMTDDGVTPLADQAGFDKAIRRVNNISVAEFIRFLRVCNSQVPQRLISKLSIRSENFDAIFTLTDSHYLEQILRQDHRVQSKQI